MKFTPPNNKDLMLALTSGHTLVVKADGSTEVPDIFRKDAISKGCNPTDIAIATPRKSTAGKSKSELLRAAIEKVLDSDNEADFDNEGQPTAEALSVAAGFTVTPTERADAIAAYEEDESEDAGKAAAEEAKAKAKATAKAKAEEAKAKAKAKAAEKDK